MAQLRPEATGRPVGKYFVIIEHLRPKFEVRSIDFPEVQAGGPSKQQAIRNFTRLLLEEIRENPDYTYHPPSSRKESENKVETFKKFVERAAGKEQVLEAAIVPISF